MSSKGREKRRRIEIKEEVFNLQPAKVIRLQNPYGNDQSSSRYMFETEDAPLEMSVAKFAESRAKELEALAKTVEQIGGNKLSFQRLPKHMRRRAMSHNIRRIPQRLRQKAQAELEKREKKGVNKRPSRRFRRRPSNLLSEYQRRQRQHMWLETHIWHAKRFKMTTAWGYRLPVHPSDKSQRACYRATAYYCLLQDVSYECCIQLKGPRQTIVDALSHLTSTDTGLTFAARSTKTGQRWESVMMYTYNKYPQGAMAPVDFLWRPGGKQVGSSEDTASSCQENKEEVRVLWLWCHPSSYDEVWMQLTTACAHQISASGDLALTEDRLNCKNSATVQLCHQQIQGESSQGGSEVQIGQVQLKSLKDQLVKFRLTGPASNLVLSETLKPANIYPEKELSPASSVEVKQRWWQSYYRAEGKEREFSAQKSCWECVAKCQCPDGLPPKAVVALTVRDPRVLIPTVRTKAALDTADSTVQQMTWDQLPSEVCVSPLMDEGTREEVTRTKMTEQDMNRQRSKLLVPGSILELGDMESRVPVLLLHRPGSPNNAVSTRSSMGSGWDLVAPKGWGMAFWVAMVYRGARVGGLRESRSLALRMCAPHFPHDYPDTAANCQLQQEKRVLAVERYVRRPPAKRINYPRLGVPTPFHYPWAQLVRQWQERGAESLRAMGVSFTIEPSSEKRADVCIQSALAENAEEKVHEMPNPGEAFGREDLEHGASCGGDSVILCSEHPDTYVLRCRRLLRTLGEVMKPTRVKQSCKMKGQCIPNTRLSQHSQRLQKAEVYVHLNSIVACTVSCHLRGVPVEHAMICLPSASDLEQLAKDSNFTGPMERLHPLCKNPCVKAATKMAKKLTNKTSSVRTSEKVTEQKADKKANMTKNESTDKGNEQKDKNNPKAGTNKQKAGKKQKASAPQKTLNRRQLQEKEELIKEVCKVVDNADRPIIGFLTNGDFDLCQGHGAGVGFCSLAGLLVALRASAVDGPLYVLIRNPSTRQYRFATLSLFC